jgi:hypothetical protein
MIIYGKLIWRVHVKTFMHNCAEGVAGTNLNMNVINILS